jgi:gluconokinase
VSCSALKRAYHDLLRGPVPRLTFLHLDGDPEVALRRVASRPGHFMPTGLVASQVATLEPLEPDEDGVVLDYDTDVEQLVSAFLDRVRANPAT